MKNQNMKDERISAQCRKINSEAYSILMIVLSASILVQQFILNAAFEQYAAELMCFIGISFYIIVRYLMLGINIYGETRRAKVLPWVSSIVTGITITVINGISNYSKYTEKYKSDGIGYFIAMLAVTFISSTAIAFVVLLFINYINTIKQAKIQKQLDKDENE